MRSDRVPRRCTEAIDERQRGRTMSAFEAAPAGAAAGGAEAAGEPTTGLSRSPSRPRRLALAALLLVGLAYATMIQSFSWNQTSHYDLIRSLNVERTNIDAYQQNTGDKVFYKGHWYSARAPGLALFALPFYDTLNALDAPKWARDRDALRGEDEVVYLIGLWGNVLPGLLLLLLVWRVAERLQPGFGAAAAVSLGLGTMILPLSTLLFSHVLAAFLGFGAFALMLRERDGPPLAARRRRPGDGLRGRLGVPAVLRRRRARPVPALAARLAERARRAHARRRVHRRRRRRHRAAAALQPLRLRFLDAPGLLQRPAPAARLLRHRRAQPEGACHAAAGLARAADDLPRADHGRDRHGPALPPRKTRRGTDDRRHLPLLRRLQLRLLPALRRRLHGPALPDDDAAVPRRAAGHRLQALPGADDRAGGGLDRHDGDRRDHPSARRL